MSKETKLLWQRNHRRQFKERFGYSTSANDGCGGVREQVLVRDGRKCVKCGMTDAEHKEKWGRPITVDHKDKNRKHNNLENLQTLCLRCHGGKDISPQLIISKCAPFKQRMIEMRKQGATYQKIADFVGVDVKAVWNQIKKWKIEELL